MLSVGGTMPDKCDHLHRCPDCREQWGPYIVVVNSPELSAAHEVKASPSASGWLTMEQASQRLGYSYFWLSRNWRKLGLHPSSPWPGARTKRMFEAKEIEEFLRAHKYTRRGRPRKIREIHA